MCGQVSNTDKIGLITGATGRQGGGVIRLAKLPRIPKIDPIFSLNLGSGASAFACFRFSSSRSRYQIADADNTGQRPGARPYFSDIRLPFNMAEAGSSSRWSTQVAPSLRYASTMSAVTRSIIAFLASAVIPGGQIRVQNRTSRAAVPTVGLLLRRTPSTITRLLSNSCRNISVTVFGYAAWICVV